MKMLHRVAALAAILAVTAPALADTSYKDASGSAVTGKSTTILSGQVPWHLSVDASGSLLGVAGNPFYVQFGSTPTFNLGTVPSLTVGSSALPTGAATAANQTANTTAITNAQAAAGTSASVAAAVQGVAGGLPIKTNGVLQLTGTDIGASVAANTATTLVAATANRYSFVLQNQTANDCWFNTIATATADYHSIKFPTGSLYESSTTHIGTGAISVICLAAGGVAGRQTTN